MRYLIVGCGRVGSTLAKLLVADKHDVVVVDDNPAAFKRLGNRFGGEVEVVAVTDGDNRNVMAALIAQRMFRIPKIIARIYDPPRGQLYRELGIDTFCPTTIGAQLIRDRLQDVSYASGPSFDFGKLASLIATVSPAQAGKRVYDVEVDGKIRITAIRRLGSVSVAAPSDMLTEGDELNAIVAPEALSDFAKAFSSAHPQARLSA